MLTDLSRTTCYPVSAPPTDTRRKVLMLAYYFPPHEAVGSHRPYEIYTRLPEFGWEPTLITAEREGTPPGVIQTPDRSWMRTVEEAERHGSGNPLLKPGLRRGTGRLKPLIGTMKEWLRLFAPWHDEYTGWSYSLFDRAVTEGRRQGVDLVWATCNPFTLAPAALRIARALGVPCVIDMRDALPSYLSFPHSANHWFYRALRQVDAVVSVAPCCLTPETLAVRGDRPIYQVISGAWHTERVPARKSEVFRIIHAGMLYRGLRRPELLFEALTTLAREFPEFRQDARLRFVGGETALIAQASGFAEVADMVELLPTTPYREVVEMMAESSVLLIINGESYELLDPLPGKFYDYLPFEAPVLAYGGAGGALAEVLAWSGSGKWMNSVAEITADLRRYYQAWKAEGIVRAPRDPDALEYLSARRMAAENAEIFNAVVEGREPACRPKPPWK